MKYLIFFFVAFFAVSIFIVGLSPFKTYEHFNRPMIKVSTLIDAPACQLFDFLGNSDSAKEWSSFVDHITLLDGVDGELNSRRRCFKDELELKEQWDEEVIEVQLCKKRRLTIYNLKNFLLQESGLITEQLYESTKSGKTKLSFMLFYKDPNIAFIPLCKMYFASFYIARIFEKNLENIKRSNTNQKTIG